LADDFFLAFSAHAHTRNDVEVDMKRDTALRTNNSPEEACKLTKVVLEKIERDISGSGFRLNDVKLLVLLLSYRGASEDKDAKICGSVLETIEKRFKGNTAANGLRLIGHTTAAELENEDLLLKEVSGIGYNGLSLLALLTGSPVGVGRTWGLANEDRAREQGHEMARDAWIDFSQQTYTKEHAQKNKALLVLTQGSKIGVPGYEHFLGEGIAGFMSGTREARITHVLGGSSGDGLMGLLFHQFYGKLGEQSNFKVLDDEAVCALVSSSSEPSVGLDLDAVKRIGRPHTFYFDKIKEPHFKHVKRISNKDPCTFFAKTIYENEVRLAEKGSPALEEKDIIEAIMRQNGLALHPTVGKYAFAFPFGNYTSVGPLRMVGRDIELLRPVRSYIPEMTGYIVMGDHEKVQKGAHNVYNMLRIDQAFGKRDLTFLVTCVSRRIVELMAGCKSKTEAEILKDGLSSTQVIGFLAYGELSFTHLIQEPYLYNYSCWGMTFPSKTNGKKDVLSALEEKVDIGIKGWLRGRKQTDRN
jgi:hypothetical protein